MSLSNLLKKGSLRGLATATPETVATDKPLSPSSVATVATVNVANPQSPAANDPVATPTTAAVDLDLIPATGDTVSDPAPPDDPDRWCWPHSSAMTGAEIATFTARLSMFTANGLSLVDGEVLAGKLATRGRESDDRRLCLECTHLAGYAGAWSCRNSQRAGVAIKSRNTGLPADLVHQLQRCNGFKGT